MDANKKVLDVLQETIAAELKAINQYVVHAAMFHSWQLKRLHRKYCEYAQHEMHHLHELLERVLALGGSPKLDVPFKLNIGANAKEILQNDLATEKEAVKLYNRAIKLAEFEADNTTRKVFECNLKEENHHLHHFEAQLHQIKEMGYEGWLAEQARN